MTLQLSTAVLNASLDAIEAAIGVSPTLEIRSGVVPPNCAAADTGTLLASMALPSNWMANAASGAKGLAGTWQDTAANAAGTAGHFRIKQGATCHIQGTVSATGNGGDLQLGTITILLGQQVSITAFSIEAKSDLSIATTPGTSLVTGLVTWTHSQSLPMGVYTCGTPFAQTSINSNLTTSPASTTATGGNGQTAWVHGLGINPGSVGTQKAGRSMRGSDTDVLHWGDTRTGYTGQGITISDKISPPGLSQSGIVLNRDPGHTGANLTIAAGSNLTAMKVVSDLTISPSTDRMESRLLDVRALHFVSSVPAVGAFAPAPASPDKSPPIYVSDIDLTGLPSVPIPSLIGNLTPETGMAPDFDHSGLFNETMRYARAPSIQNNYGRDIANQFGKQALLLLGLASPDTKLAIAKWFIKTAIGITGRIREGGLLGGVVTSGAGGQIHNWPLIVAVAAWLTRNSSRGQYFRDLLSGPFASQFNIHFGAPRVMQDSDWIIPATIYDREAPSGLVNPGYFSQQPRSGLRGNVWAHPDISAAGSGAIGARIGQNDYMWVQFGSSLAIALFLSRVPGGRALVPYPDYWTWMEMVADVAIWNRQFSTDGDTSDPGEYKTEAYLSGTEIPGGVADSLIDANIGWPFQTGSAPAVQAVEFTPGFEIMREIGDGSRAYAVEHSINIHFDRYLSRNPAWLPVKAAFTITRNGVPLVIDETGAAGADPRDIGAIQIRGKTIILFTATPLLATDIIEVWTNFAGNAASRPRTPAGALAADIPSSAPRRAVLVSATVSRPTTQHHISFGGFDAAAGTVDTPKYFYTEANYPYLQAKFGVQPTDIIRTLLVGIRGRMSPNAASRVASAMILGDRIQSDRSAIYVNGNNLVCRLAGVGVTRTATITNFFSGADDAVPPDYAPRTYWFEVQIVPGGTSVLRARNQDALSGPATFTTGYASDAEAPRISSLLTRMSVFGRFDGAATPTPLNPSRFGMVEMCISFGTDRRPIVMPALGLADPVFAPDFDWGNRHERILPTRADYAIGPPQAGTPEYSFSPLLEQVSANLVQNLGCYSLISGRYSDPDQTSVWTKLGNITASVPDFSLSSTTVASGWTAPVVGNLLPINAPNMEFEVVGYTNFSIVED